MSQLSTDAATVDRTRTGGRVIVAVESDEHDRGPIAWAERYARFHERPMVVVHTYTSAPPPPLLGVTDSGVWVDPRAVQAMASHVAGGVVDRLRAHGVDVTSMTLPDRAGEGIVSIAHPDDVVVAGTEGGGAIRHFLHGGTVHGLLRHAPCPVVVVPAGWHSTLADGRGHIVVGFDGTDRSRAALRWAAKEAARFGTTLEAVHAVMPDPDGIDLRRDAHVAGAVAGEEGVEVDVTSVVSTTDGLARSLVTVARGAELLVLGNHRASWFAALAAYSVPERAVLNPLCPVAVIPCDPPVDGTADPV